MTPESSGLFLDWSDSARALLVQLAPLPIALPWAIRLDAFLHDETAEPFLDRPMVALLRRAIFGYALASLVFAGVFYLLHRRKRDSQAFVFVVLGTLAIGVGGASHLLGTISSPMLGGVLAVSNAILLLFSPRQAIMAIAAVIACYFGPLVAVATGHAPYAPLFAYEPVVDHVPQMTWVRDLSFLAVTIIVVPLAIQAVVLNRWRRKDELVHHLACFDPLTGVANRRHFFDLADHEMARAKRVGTGPGLVLVDIDHFKAVNDRHGHQVGDEALRHVAAVLSEAARRKVDVVGRYGGEEFAILAPDTGPDGLALLAERCRASIEQSPIPCGDAEPIRLTASFGVAAFESGDASIDVLVRRADDALYRAKRAGRNRVESGRG